MIRRPPPPVEERCPRTKCIRRRAVVDGVLGAACLKHLTKPRNKFGAKRASDGIRWYDSGMERERGKELIVMEQVGAISALRFQVPYELHGLDGSVVCRYRADFVYVRDGVEIVEDVKGKRTDLYDLKAKLFRAEYGFAIYETNGRKR